MKNLISLPTSVAEALDKLAILTIKKVYIQDENCKKEWDIVYNAVTTYLENSTIRYYYRLLCDINTAIWKLQEKAHIKDIEIYDGIIFHNDRRFKVKQKISRYLNSSIQEVKSYKAKKCFIYTHLGLGDMIWMNGAVRYLATIYDSVLVVCKEKNILNISNMYQDDSTISLTPIKNDMVMHPFAKAEAALKMDGYDVYSCGANVGKKVFDLPNSFYDDLKMDRRIRLACFHHPRLTLSINLFSSLFQYKPYVFIHEQSSSNWQVNKSIYKELFTKDGRLILDPNFNHYDPSHKFYNAAQSVIGLPLASYIDIIENAEELHMVESSFYCLASHLDLSKVRVKKCYFPYDNAERLGIFSTGVL